MKTMTLIVSILFVFFGLGYVPALAATYYVNPTALNDSGNGSVTSPKKYISSGIALMSGGDTLVLEDGTYSGDNLASGTASNMISVNNYHGRKFPPNGSVGNYTTIRARNVGQAIIDGQYTSTPFHNGNANLPASYLHIDGIHFRNGAGSSDPVGGGVFGLRGVYSKVTNCGFEDGGPSSDNGQWPIASFSSDGTDPSSYMLIEDCWFWGRGRYGAYFSGGGGRGNLTNSIMRRIVVRQDSVPNYGPYSGMMFYNANDSACQNCIVIDTKNSGTAESYGAFAITNNFEATDPVRWSRNNIVNGSIALNNQNYSGYLPQNDVAGFTMTNTVLWGNIGTAKDGAQLSPSVVGTSTIKNTTSGANSRLGFYRNTSYSGIMTIDKVIAVNNGDAGIQSVQNVSNINTYGNAGGGVIGSTVTGLNRIYNPFTNGLTYLPRIESGSALATDNIGATIMYQIGAGSKFYGETGWNTISTTPLWPFPNETIWAAKMKAYTASGPGGNRGFAALSGSSSTPLTDYIWGYLGNTVPPFNLTSAPTGNSIVLNWSANTANANITGYKVYVGTSPGTYNLTGYVGGKSVGNVTTETIAGLAQDTLYYAAVTAVDSIKGASGYSYEISFKTGPKPPTGLKVISVTP